MQRMRLIAVNEMVKRVKMADEPLQAIVVDDDQICRKVIAFALEQEGFVCAHATSGDDAIKQLSATPFDLVVTDLCMPVRHGHSLAVEVLSMENRPLVIIHSGVTDPRMTRELITRGVDDVIYKPTNYAGFAAKAFVWSIRRRRQRLLPQVALTSEGTHDNTGESNHECAAVDVFFATTLESLAFKELAQKIVRDEELSNTVLEVANSTQYNRSQRRITDVMEAIQGVGLRKLADVALDRLQRCD